MDVQLLNSPPTKFYDLPVFLKTRSVTSETLYSTIKSDPSLSLYVPDEAKVDSIPKSYMYQIIHDVKPQIYNQMKEAASTLKQKKIYKVQAKFKINIKENTANEILNFETEEHTAKEKRSTFVHVKEKGSIISVITGSKNSNINKSNNKASGTNAAVNNNGKKQEKI